MIARPTRVTVIFDTSLKTGIIKSDFCGHFTTLVFLNYSPKLQKVRLPSKESNEL